MSFSTLNVFCGQSNHFNNVRIDCDWKVMILFGTEIGWLMCYDLGMGRLNERLSLMLQGYEHIHGY